MIAFFKTQGTKIDSHHLVILIVSLPGTVAASMMSTAAVANGGGVASMAAWGVVATLQSVGAAGAVSAVTTAGAMALDGSILTKILMK